MITFTLLYLIIGLALLVWMHIDQGPPASRLTYPIILFGWPFIMWHCWRAAK